MAALYARHSRGCALGQVDTKPGDGDGCTCSPVYYVMVWQGSKGQKVRVGKNKKQANRALDKIRVETNEGSYRPLLSIKFSEWADRWLGGLELKETTKHSYRGTMSFAKKSLGGLTVRDITPTDIKRFSASLRDVNVTEPRVNGHEAEQPRKMSDSTRAKHLRVLGVCLASAIVEGYAARNPVRELKPGEKPKRRGDKEAAYFENDELPVLFAHVDDDLMRTLFLAALKTGARQGELLAVEWRHVDLTEGLLRVRRSITNGHVSTPKNRKFRDIDLTDDVVELLGGWWGECGKPDDTTLVFGGATKTGYLNPQVITRSYLYPTLEAAGIPREGPTGEARTFHSFRHTFAKRALESGASIAWLSRHLGHSSVNVTTEVYGHFEKSERKRQAGLLAGAFGV